MRFAHLLILASVFALPLGAHAQWQWIDKDNKKVFSDTAPPPEVPEQNILRRPAAAARRAAAPAPATTDAAPAAASAPKAAGVDKSLEEKTRKAKEAEDAKQAAEAAKLAQAKTENCNRARQGKATMDSGMRVAQMNAQGERVIMDDDARAAENKRLQAAIDSDCK
jgi:hypothetical protein